MWEDSVLHRTSTKLQKDPGPADISYHVIKSHVKNEDKQINVWSFFFFCLDLRITHFKLNGSHVLKSSARSSSWQRQPTKPKLSNSRKNKDCGREEVLELPAVFLALWINICSGPPGTKSQNIGSIWPLRLGTGAENRDGCVPWHVQASKHRVLPTSSLYAWCHSHSQRSGVRNGYTGLVYHHSTFCTSPLVKHDALT